MKKFPDGEGLTNGKKLTSWQSFSIIVFVTVLLFLAAMGIRENQARIDLDKINQQIALFNSITPEEHYKKVKQDLLRQKKRSEEILEFHKDGTLNASYKMVVGMPEVSKEILERLLE